MKELTEAYVVVKMPGFQLQSELGFFPSEKSVMDWFDTSAGKAFRAAHETHMGTVLVMRLEPSEASVC